MIDYSVRMRCQAAIADGRRCVRRGRNRISEDGWLCWQHSYWRWWPEKAPVTVLKYPPEQLAW